MTCNSWCKHNFICELLLRNMSSVVKLVRRVSLKNGIKQYKKCNEYKDRMEYLSEIYQNYLKGYGNYGPDWLKKYNKYDLMLYDKYHKRNCPKYMEINGKESKSGGRSVNMRKNKKKRKSLINTRRSRKKQTKSRKARRT